MAKTQKKTLALLSACALFLALACLILWLGALPPAPAPLVGEYPDAGAYQRQFGADPAYTVGVTAQGKPAFSDPEGALALFCEEHKEALDLVARENGLAGPSHKTARLYKTYGWQTAAQDPSLGEGCRLVTSFFDIYENSYPTGAFM